MIAFPGARVAADHLQPRLQERALVRRTFRQHQDMEYGPTVSAALAEYWNYTELEAHMHDLARRCSDVVRLYSIGRSVEGRELWALEVSDAPGRLEAEPNAKYVANMHGDEPSGRQLLVALAEWLCVHHRRDARAGRIVADMHLHLLPTMNPDGFEVNVRGNARGTDLNRDFPDPIERGAAGVQRPSGNEQPETLAVMDWIRSGRFVASASLHEGAVVANYPWDGSEDRGTHYAACPDDAAYVHLASMYASAHASMAASAEFPGGITNGAAWYPLWGGMQDWNYLAGKCMELTLELSAAKGPPAALLPQLFADNLAALLAFPLAAAFGGLRGLVMEAPTEPGGQRRLAAQAPKPRPLPARIDVLGINHTIVASPEFGVFYRPLAPGTYNVTASLDGHEAATATVSVPADGSGAQHAFSLVPLGAVTAAVVGGAASGWDLPRRFGAFGGPIVGKGSAPAGGLPAQLRWSAGLSPHHGATAAWEAAIGSARQIASFARRAPAR
ncbi:hypothetical protein WJX81_003069 [Elliptochloris bilobata]|uniref:Peptidase M14 domain-containing protein n=1 Tax=Elliptochloris bilobata TaxID=381761 RepID=A0AAW1RBQ1_9CHLO